MDFKVNREIISSDEVIYDGAQEQAVELDCILPDYYPDIFKILKCMVYPSVMSQTVSGDKVNYELFVKVNIIYCSENSRSVQCIEQKMTFSKSVDLGTKCDNPVISLVPCVDYVNCRAVNQRRLDIRGAVSTRIKAICEKKCEAVCDAFGMNIQLKSENISVVGSKLNSKRYITVNEDIDIGYSKPSIISIIRSNAVNMSIDKKIIANKIVVKGEAKVNLLYSCSKDGNSRLEPMEFTVPYSQIIDMEGIDENYECMLEASIIRCELSVTENDDGEMKIIEAELCICISCCAMKTANVKLVTDAYSTTHNCECIKSDTAVEAMPKRYCEIHMEKIPVSSEECKVDCIHDAWSNVKNTSVSVDYDSNSVLVSGTVAACVMVCTEEGAPILLEKEQTFEHKFVCPEMMGKVSAKSCAEVISTAYSITDTGGVELKSEIRICVNLCMSGSHNIITDIEIDEESVKKSGDYALKMYFADEDETLWDIAKQYSTSIDAIIEENENGELLEGRRMLLIPIVS